MAVHLVLVRHAEAGDPDPKKYPDDAARPLTKKGAKKFAKAARGLGQLAKPDRVLCSPSARTSQTAQLLSQHAGWPEPVANEALDDDHSPGDVIKAVTSLEDKPKVVGLVGHGPNLLELLTRLTDGHANDDAPNFDKGGAAMIKIKRKIKPGTGKLEWMLDQKSLKDHR